MATIPAVGSAVYGIIEFLKKFVFCSDEKFKKYIPILSCLFGATISLIVFLTNPNVVPCGDWFSALIVGAASGLSAVGVNQIKKQTEKKEGEIDGS